MKLILCGGGWADKTVIPNTVFESIIDATKPILYIPFARPPKDDGYAASKIWLAGEMANISHGEIDMVNSADEILTRDLNDYAAIFIGGGNTFKLLDDLKKSGAFAMLRDYIDADGIVYGCSAGAIIFGDDIASCLYMDPNDVELTDTAGFDCACGAGIGAHYTNKDATKTAIATDALTRDSMRSPIIALPEEDSLYINGDKIQIIGTRPYYIFNAGRNRAFKPGDVYSRDEFTTLIKSV